MIIFGSTTLNSVQQSGAFHCPRCSMQRNYRWKVAKRFFTLYFIPLIPLGKVGEYIECSSCGGTYGIEVLSYDPGADRARLMEGVRRILVLTLVAAERTDSRYVKALCEAGTQLIGTDFTENEVNEDIRLARAANANLAVFVQQQAGDLSDQGRSLILQAAEQIFAVAGQSTRNDQSVLAQLAAALGTPYQTRLSDGGNSPRRLGG